MKTCSTCANSLVANNPKCQGCLVRPRHLTGPMFNTDARKWEHRNWEPKPRKIASAVK